MDFDVDPTHEPSVEPPDWTPLLKKLFPLGFGGADVLRELAPEGWERSPLHSVFHPTPEKVLEESLRLHHNLRELIQARGKEDDSPVPTLDSVKASYKETPIEPTREAGELLGMCLWDVFSDNHDVVTADGQTVDIGSFRGAAGFLAEHLDRALGTHQYSYMDFYMGTIWVRDRADLTPVYELIFRRFKSHELDWSYSFPRLSLVDMRPLHDSLQAASDARPEWEGYSASKAFAEQAEEQAKDREIERMREELDALHAEAVEEARRQPPPRTVEAYRKVYGRFPPGWPP